MLTTEETECLKERGDVLSSVGDDMTDGYEDRMVGFWCWGIKHYCLVNRIVDDGHILVWVVGDDTTIGVFGVGNEVYLIAKHHSTEDVEVEVPTELDFPPLLEGKDIWTPVTNGAEDWKSVGKAFGGKCIFVCPLSM